MIISSNKIQSVLKAYAEQNSAAKSANTDKGKSTQQPDQVILSPGVQEFGPMLQRIIAMPDVRQDKVNELSAKIEAGNYQVNSKDVAEKIIGRTLSDNLR